MTSDCELHLASSGNMNGCPASNDHSGFNLHLKRELCISSQLAQFGLQSDWGIAVTGFLKIFRFDGAKNVSHPVVCYSTLLFGVRSNSAVAATRTSSTAPGLLESRSCWPSIGRLSTNTRKALECPPRLLFWLPTCDIRCKTCRGPRSATKSMHTRVQCCHQKCASLQFPKRSLYGKGCGPVRSKATSSRKW